MVFTQRKIVGKKKYFYRVQSVRKADKVAKKVIYMGVDLSPKALVVKEDVADYNLGIAILTKEQIKELDKIKSNYAKLPEITNEQRYESFCSLFTYDSTAIEGNTLTLAQTAELLFEGKASAKSLRETYEVLNHKKAFDYMLCQEDIDKVMILQLHKLIMANLHQKQIGMYRTVQVYIKGVKWLPTPADNVAKEMAELLKWYTRNKKTIHPLVLASYIHVQFEYIHPFVDGNGRVGRLLLNFILHKYGYPMISIPFALRSRYYEVLQDAQLNDNLRGFVLFLLDIYRNEHVMY